MKRLLILVTLTTLAAAHGASAQVPASTPADAVTNVAVDPIRCWWRTSAGSVRLGEQFDLWLTCAALENQAVQVVPDQTHLGAEVATMAPFEIVSGSHPADIRSGERRFFQYQYVLRILNRDAIGRDIRVPDTIIHYKVNSKVGANSMLQGRDLMYVMPQQSIRIATMVPQDATDIRDSEGESFSNAESLGFRASVLEIIALTCIALGVLMTIFALVRLAGRARRMTPADERLLPTRTLIGAAVHELGAVRRDREGQGWNQALASRALAATRIVAACAIGRPVSQRVAKAGAVDGAGCVIASGPLRGKRRSLSSPVTTETLTRYLSTHPSDAPNRQSIDDLRDALAAFSVTQYGRQAVLDQSALDSALSSAVAAGGRVQAEHSWIKDAFRFLTGSVPAVESRA